MELKEIVTVSGKGGLFKVVKPTRTGMILESLDQQKTRLVAGPQHRLSLLSEISIYTHTSDGSTPLTDVLHTLYNTYGRETLPVNSKSEPSELVEFMEKAVPDYDRDRVYASDIKKLANWYSIMLEYAPEILEKEEAEAPQQEVETPAEEQTAIVEEPKKPAAKKKQKDQA